MSMCAQEAPDFLDRSGFQFRRLALDAIDQRIRR
jgi:hypothetical protein